MRRSVWIPLSRFWKSDGSLTVLLILLIIVTLILPAVRPDLEAPGAVAIAIFSAMLFAGAATIWSSADWLVRSVAVFCLLAVPGPWLGWWYPSPALEAWNAATESLVCVLLAVVVLTSVLRAGSFTRRQIQGGVAAYLLLGLAWAAAYQWLSVHDPGAFTGTGASSHQWTYYSLVTLTTMGYGDITPVHPAARSLAVAEALTGQLYVAILISRLVALELQNRKSR